MSHTGHYSCRCSPAHSTFDSSTSHGLLSSLENSVRQHNMYSRRRRRFTCLMPLSFHRLAVTSVVHPKPTTGAQTAC